jgi:hypothetical protein
MELPRLVFILDLLDSTVAVAEMDHEFTITCGMFRDIYLY